MEFDVYCDEALPDLFTSKIPGAQFLMIGGVWLPRSLAQDLKQQIYAARAKTSCWGEIKWTKVSPSKLEFYERLIDIFMSYGAEMRFRCIAIDSKAVDFARHNNDQELGFYKFYYQLIHHWVLDFNNYRIFCDTKSTRDPNRLADLKRCLGHANIFSTIDQVQALPSKEVVAIQLCDLLLGAASSRLNRTLRAGSAKERLVRRLENALNVPELRPTSKGVEKFNIFRIQLSGGW